MKSVADLPTLQRVFRVHKH